MIEPKISAVFEFTKSGYLEAILLNAESETDQVTLERALDRLFKPYRFGWIKRLFRK